MPRPKVSPEDRKRSVQACVPCRISKVRCDSKVPCEGCKRRNKESSCKYLEGPYEQAHARRKSRQDASSSSSHQLGSVDGSQSATTSSNHTGNASVILSPPEEVWAPSSHTTQSRMLLSSKGEKVYIGRTAALSYLHFLRQVLKQHVGSSSFTENEFNGYMLEAGSNHGELDDLGQMEEERKQALIQSYFEASSAILDLFTKEEMVEYLALENRQLSVENLTKSDRGNLAALQLVIAIGGQCRGMDAADTRYAASFFAHGQRYAFDGLLCDPSLNMIRVFLLMSYYMLGACRRNAAFMYLGVASRGAKALGLHRDDQYRLLSDDERALRLRIWKSLCILDTIVSSILGRPGKSSSLWPDISEFLQVEGALPRVAVNLSYELCSHLDKLEEGLWKGKNVEFASAESFLHKLRQLSQKMPLELRQFSANTLSSGTQADKEHLLGGVHVACIYYFAVILVTRPFLTSHVMYKLVSKSPKAPSWEVIKNAEDRQQIANLSQVCLDSAIFMAKMVNNAMEAGLLLKNMCLLKAWMFAAGLLLGFALFGEEGEQAEVEDALNGARAVLFYLSDVSAQAKHYYEILSSFYEAIYKSRQQQTDERRRMTKRYVDQIFTLDFDQPGQSSYLSPISGGETSGSIESVDDFSFDALLSMGGVTVDDAANIPMLWDDFSAD